MKDVINREEIFVEYFPAGKMWSDLLTKPFQGKSYQITRSKLINMPKLYLDTDENTP